MLSICRRRGRSTKKWVSVCSKRWPGTITTSIQVKPIAAPTSPGNKKGGLANVVEKALGLIAKSGKKSAIAEVLSPCQRPTKRGLIFAATPASDFVCGTQQVASGITVQVFTTGRGTPYGLVAVPVIKMATRTSWQTAGMT